MHMINKLKILMKEHLYSDVFLGHTDIIAIIQSSRQVPYS